MEQLFFKNKMGQVCQTVQVVGRVGKDEVVFIACLQQKLEHIGFEGMAAFEVEVLEIVLYKLDMQRLHLYAGNTVRSSGKAFYGKCTRAAKKVKHIHLIKINQMTEYIEKSFASEVSRGPSFKILWNKQAPAFECAGYYAHRMCKWAGKEARTFLPSSVKAGFTCLL